MLLNLVVLSTRLFPRFPCGSAYGSSFADMLQPLSHAGVKIFYQVQRSCISLISQAHPKHPHQCLLLVTTLSLNALIDQRSVVQLPQERAEDHHFNYHHTLCMLSTLTTTSHRYSMVFPTCNWSFFSSHDGRLPEKRGHRPANMPNAYTIAYSSIVSHYPRYAVTLRTSVQTFF